MTRKDLGRTGEAVAARYYQKKGYLLLAHNYRTRLGELDLVLKKDRLIVICEVKTRSPGAMIPGWEAVDVHKQQRILAAAAAYLAASPFRDLPVRLDVAEVTPLPQGGWQVHCIENAFTAG